MGRLSKVKDITSIIEKLEKIKSSGDLQLLQHTIEELKAQQDVAETDNGTFDKASLLYDFSREALVIIHNKIIVDCTPAFARITGYDCNELQDRNFLDIVHPDYITTVLELLNSNDGVIAHYMGVAKNRTTYFAEIIIFKTSLIDDNFFVLVRDITNQKQLEEQLRESEGLFKNLANTTSVAIMLYQGDRWVYANPAATKISEYAIDELKAMNYWAFVAPDFQQLILDRGKMRQRGDDVPSGYEFKIVSKSGKEKWVYLDGKLTLYNGRPAGLISIIEITPMKNVELNLKHKNLKLEEADRQLQLSNDQLNRLNIQLQEQNAILKAAKDRAEESDRLKSAFLANMSHEIRTPMNAIMGFAEILADADVLLKEQKEYGQTIYSRAQHLLQIINDIVDISKIEANLLSIHKSTFDINLVLDDIRKLFVSVLKQKNKIQVEIQVQKLDGKSPLLIHTDKHRLEQVLSNLIDNAIKFTDDGVISFGYDLPNNNTMEFFVADTGVGIPSNETQKIFDRFVMAHNAVNEKHQGTGLGLAISKSLTNLLGGKIWIESSTDKGTVFRFRIRIDDPKYDKEEVHAIAVDKKEGDVLYKKNILIVEDDKASINYLETILLERKANVYVCNTGEQGIAFLQSEKPCDLVLLDIKLPGISGLETVAKMKLLNPQIPIIAQTAYALNEDRDKTLAAGCDDYIAKPINSNKLIELLVKHLERK